MLHLNTIGPLSIHLGSTRLPIANQQAFSALFYLAVEGGKPTTRRALAEMFFPDSPFEAASHSVRQLLYRLHQKGAEIDADAKEVVMPARAVRWDVADLLTRGWASSEELDGLRRGYLHDHSLLQSERFAAWLDEHRTVTGTLLRHLLLDQMKAERAARRYRALDGISRAVLALDPLNEEATLAAAESLAMSGAKSQALTLLDTYLDEIGSRSADLRVPPRILRERISEYVPNPDPSEQLPLVGRDHQLANLLELIEQSAAGSARACVVTGPSGIG
jgi:DNA-binding SARP family transcriptional activator